MRARELHSNYYRDRWSESDLCNDFPGDEIFIDGLYAMQRHFDNNGVNLTIPVVRVMNAAHFLAAYMFATTCSGDRMEYDSLADMSLGKDRQMFRVTMIVLAAMLERTEGFRARQCRNLILDDRDPDFEEGITLYEHFLRSAEKRFAEEDFLIDTHAQIQRLTAENEQLIAENKELKYQYQLMKNQQNNQYNNCIIYQAPVYNTNTTNNYYQQPTDPKVEDVTPVEEPEPKPSKSPKDILEIPREGKYTEVRRYIKERILFDEEFKRFYEDSTRVELCARLTKEFGWFVDPNSLGKNLNRKR